MSSTKITEEVEGEMETLEDRQNKFRELWEKASNPASSEEAIDEANRELCRLQQEYWKEKERLYWESLGL